MDSSGEVVISVVREFCMVMTENHVDKQTIKYSKSLVVIDKI